MTEEPLLFKKNKQYVQFCLYGFLKNLRFYDAFLLLFLLENNLSYSQVGILYAIREITTNLAEIPSGIIADSFGRKRALLGAFGLYIISFVVFYYSSHFQFLLIAMFLIGIGDAFRSGTHKGMIMDYLSMNNWKQHKVAYYGQTRSWSQLGSAVSALMAGLMVFYSGGYRIIYLLSTIPYVLNFINIATYPKELNFSLKTKGSTLGSFKSVINNFLENIKKRKVLEVVNSAALHSAFLKAIKDYIQPLLLNIAILLPFFVSLDTKRKSGLLIGIAYFFIFILTSQASKSAPKLAALPLANIPKKTLLVGLLFGILSGVLFLFKIWWGALLFFVMIYLIENVRKPILVGLLADHVSNNILTSVISAQSFYQTIVTALLAVLLGLFADHLGIGFALAITSTILLLFTLVIGNSKKE